MQSISQPASIFWTMISLRVESLISWILLIHQGMRSLKALCENCQQCIWLLCAFNPVQKVEPRLALLFLLRSDPNGFASHFGIKCSSFSKMNVGTSQRSACGPIGHVAYKSVAVANKLLERKGLGS